MSYDELRGAIAQRHRALSGRLQQIAEFVLDHPTDVALGTVAEIAERSGVPPSAMRRAVEGFTGLEHALERVAEIDGVQFVNDSKATNIASAQKALESFPAHVVAIMGGRFKGGAFEDLRDVVATHADAIAGIILTPFRHDTFHDSELPAPGYLEGVRSRCDRHGIVFVLDDVRAGFRLHLGGSGEYFGVRPDLGCYCKAIANGYPLSACVGREALRRGQEVIYVTERAVFRLTDKGLALTEIAPGIDLRRDVLERMKFAPLVERDPALMAASHFDA